MRVLRCSVIILFALGFVTDSSAAIITWETVLSSSQENPPNASSATGVGSVTFDDATNVLSVDLSWSGLTGDGQQAHIHCCVSPTGNIGIALDLWLVGSPQPATGSFSASYDLDLVNPFRAAFTTANGGSALSAFAALRAAMDAPLNAYYNIHTATFPGGEIRGNLAPTQVAEPSALLLFAIAGGALRLRRWLKQDD